MNEVPNMLQQVFTTIRQPPPSQMDIMYAMWKFDADKSGQISQIEFRRMLYFFAGLTPPN